VIKRADGSAVEVGQVISASDTLSVQAKTQTAGMPVLDDLLLQIYKSDGGLSYARVDFALEGASPISQPGGLTVTPTTPSVNENTTIPSGGIQVATISKTDPNAVLSVTGADAGRFEIRDGKLFLVNVSGGTNSQGGAFNGTVPDFEQRSRYTVQINADNPAIGLGGTPESFQPFVLNIANQPDTLQLSSTNAKLFETQPGGLGSVDLQPHVHRSSQQGLELVYDLHSAQEPRSRQHAGPL